MVLGIIASFLYIIAIAGKYDHSGTYAILNGAFIMLVNF
jgi:hypothetical protein